MVMNDSAKSDFNNRWLWGKKSHSHLLLVLRYPVSEDFVVTYAVMVYSATIAGVALNGINDTVLDLLDNTGVVGLSVLRTRRTLVIPIKENNHSGDWLGRTVYRPQPHR